MQKNSRSISQTEKVVEWEQVSPTPGLGCFPGAQQAVLPKTVSHFLNYLFLDFQEKAKQFLEEQLVGRRGSTLNSKAVHFVSDRNSWGVKWLFGLS
jgi:hypothetical protein